MFYFLQIIVSLSNLNTLYLFSKYTFFAGDPLQGTLFVKLQLSCSSPIELSYYSTTANVERKDICCHCASEGAERDKNATPQYRTVLPICTQCKSSGKEIVKRLFKKWIWQNIRLAIHENSLIFFKFFLRITLPDLKTIKQNKCFKLYINKH